jgi:hypothetical protein
MQRIRSRIFLTAALLLAVLTGLSGPALAGPSDRLPGDDAIGSPARLAGVDSPAGGFGLNRPLEQQSPAIQICKIAGIIPAGSPVTIRVTGASVVEQPITVGTTCPETPHNEFTNFGNFGPPGTVVSIQETAPTNSRILPGPSGSGGCFAHLTGSGTILPCNVDASGVASLTLPAQSAGGQIDVVLTNGGADLKIDKIDAPDPVVVGQNLNYE